MRLWTSIGGSTTTNAQATKRHPRKSPGPRHTHALKRRDTWAHVPPMPTWTQERVFLKRRPKNDDLRPKTPWTKTKTCGLKRRPSGLKRRPPELKRRPSGLKRRPPGLKRRPHGLKRRPLWIKLLRRFRSVVEFPLDYLIVIMKSITHLFFDRTRALAF